MGNEKEWRMDEEWEEKKKGEEEKNEVINIKGSDIEVKRDDDGDERL